MRTLPFTDLLFKVLSVKLFSTTGSLFSMLIFLSDNK